MHGRIFKAVMLKGEEITEEVIRKEDIELFISSDDSTTLYESASQCCGVDYVDNIRQDLEDEVFILSLYYDLINVEPDYDQKRARKEFLQIVREINTPDGLTLYEINGKTYDKLVKNMMRKFLNRLDIIKGIIKKIEENKDKKRFDVSYYLYGISSYAYPRNDNMFYVYGDGFLVNDVELYYTLFSHKKMVIVDVYDYHM